MTRRFLERWSRRKRGGRRKPDDARASAAAAGPVRRDRDAEAALAEAADDAAEAWNELGLPDPDTLEHGAISRLSCALVPELICVAARCAGCGGRTRCWRSLTG